MVHSLNIIMILVAVPPCIVALIQLYNYIKKNAVSRSDHPETAK